MRKPLIRYRSGVSRKEPKKTRTKINGLVSTSKGTGIVQSQKGKNVVVKLREQQSTILAPFVHIVPPKKSKNLFISFDINSLRQKRKR